MLSKLMKIVLNTFESQHYNFQPTDQSVVKMTKQSGYKTSNSINILLFLKINQIED